MGQSGRPGIDRAALTMRHGWTFAIPQAQALRIRAPFTLQRIQKLQHT